MGYNKKNKIRNFTKINTSSNAILHVVFIIICIAMILPMLFVVIISISAQSAIDQNGYSFFPQKLSFTAYKFVFTNSGNIIQALSVSVFITVIGTLLSTYLIASYAYAISRRTFRYRRLFTIIALIPMLVSAGMVANYLIMVNLLKLKDSLWALILPLAMNSFFVFILRSFFQVFVSDSVIESAKMDGASEFRIFWSIVLPIAKPGIATVALFQTLAYWNDWFNALLYIDDAKKYPIQYLLIKTENTVQFLQRLSSELGIAVIEATKFIPKDTLRMAIVVVIVLPIAFAYPYFQKYFVHGLSIGSVKE